MSGLQESTFPRRVSGAHASGAGSEVAILTATRGTLTKYFAAGVAAAAIVAAGHPASAAKWVSHAQMPATRYIASEAAIDGVVYVAGGSGSGCGPCNTLYSYNIVGKSWNQLQNIPYATQNAMGAALDGEFYLVGGDSSTYTNVLYRYDPPTNTWTQLASLSHDADTGMAGAIAGKLYVLTGSVDGTPTPDFDVYDPGTNSWTSLPQPSSLHEYGAFGVINGKFYVAGGKDTSGNANPVTEVYDPIANSWTVLVNLPSPLFGPASAALNGKLYFAGGKSQDNPHTAVSTVSIYDFHTNKWSSGTSLPIALAGVGGGSAEYGLLWVNTGQDSSGNYTGTNESLAIPGKIP